MNTSVAMGNGLIKQLRQLDHLRDEQ